MEQKSIKEKIMSINWNQKIKTTANFIKENAEDLVTIAMAGGTVLYLLTLRVDQHKYNKARVKLMKAEAKSKQAYAKKYGIR